MGTDSTSKKRRRQASSSFLPSHWNVLFRMRFIPRALLAILLPASLLIFFMAILLSSSDDENGGGQTTAARSFLRSILPSSSSSTTSDCLLSFGKYKGIEYKTPEGSSTSTRTVGQPKCLVESKFMKLQQHAVQQPGSSSIITDWLWIDYHDRINVLVQAPDSTDEFLVFEQTKYALEGRTSLAVVGGMIEPGEEPEQAARREVAEEMTMACDNFHFLGRYRTDVNRGAGWTNTFLATTCHKLTAPEQKQLNGDSAAAAAVAGKEEEVGPADTERQDLRRISLQELREAVVAGKFLEIQWSATVALALLHPDLMQ